MAIKFITRNVTAVFPLNMPTDGVGWLAQHGWTFEFGSINGPMSKIEIISCVKKETETRVELPVYACEIHYEDKE